MAHLTALDDAAWQGPWRRVRVGEKVALSTGLLLTAVLAPPWPATLLVGLSCLALTLGVARIPVRVLTLAMAPPLVFLALGGLTVALVIGQTPPVSAAFVFGPVWADPASLTRGATAFGRGVAGTLAIMMLATTTPMVDLLDWVRRRGVPAPLVEIASLIYRLLFVLLDAARTMHAAQTARLGRPRLATAASTTGTLLLRSAARASALQAGLEGRGYVDRLPTLPMVRPASVPLIATTVVLLTGIWVVIGVVAR